MLPTPEMRVWSRIARLTPVCRCRSRLVNPSASNSGSSGSRAMCAISGGSSAPSSLNDMPPMIREAELTTVVEGQGDAEMSRRIGIGLRDEELAAHSEMAQHGITTVELHPEILASPRGADDRTSLEPVDEVRGSGQV